MNISPVLTLLLVLGGTSVTRSALPPDFVYVKDVIPLLVEEIRYAGYHNFVGRPIASYQAPLCILTRQAAAQLAAVNSDLLALAPQAYTLKAYDCYRPQSAVDDFVAWSQNLSAQAMKAEFYPHVAKDVLFRDGYIARHSGHSRGSTLDLTIVPYPVPEQEKYHPGDPLRSCTASYAVRFRDNSIDMASGFDCFDPVAHTNATVGSVQREHRQLLLQTMEKHQFKNYVNEWWHFTLLNEPYPKTYFDFPVA